MATHREPQRQVAELTAQVARLASAGGEMRDVVQAALDWVENEGECYFCMLCIGWDGDPRHDEGCPLGGDWPTVQEQVAAALGERAQERSGGSDGR